MTQNTDRYRTYVTQTGFGLEALANQQGIKVDFAKLVVGDGELPDSSNPANQTDLINQVRHYPVTIEVDDKDPTIWVARAEIPAEDGGFYIREAGVKITNENGSLYSYARQPGDYKPVLEEGSSKSYTIRLKFIPGNASVIEAKIDPSVQFATPTDLSNAIKEHEDKQDPHPQYASNDDLSQTMQLHLNSDDPHEQYMTEEAFALSKASQDEVDLGVNDNKYVTPKKLRWGFSFSISGTSGCIVFPIWLGGLMFQWGRTTISLSSGPTSGSYYGSASVNYSVTFPNDVLWFSPVPVNTGGIEGACSLGDILNANAQYYCHCTASVPMETRWFAIGY
ncbi:phage tail protein [Vibrio aestuarianus]|uniref:phage tail protein n=1 Tax=Vibrio aestuarianus TaxID=28171 RepID=UPI00237D19B1|nr:phage tail protein [Vibrio aestuarianus]MDE1333320.1 phage tail protein [Vibrio aestuarianus]